MYRSCSTTFNSKWRRLLVFVGENERERSYLRDSLSMTFGSPLIFTRFCPVLTGNLYKRVISARPVYKLTLMILLSSTDTRSTTFVGSNGGGADASLAVEFVMVECKETRGSSKWLYTYQMSVARGIPERIEMNHASCGGGELRRSRTGCCTATHWLFVLRFPGRCAQFLQFSSLQCVPVMYRLFFTLPRLLLVERDFQVLDGTERYSVLKY